MFYISLKKIIKKFPYLWKFLRWFKDSFLLPLSREKDVFMMMILFLVWPEQTYRFSTRKVLPSKKNRFSKNSRPIIPYDLLKSKSSNIKAMKEINLVGLGSSFDMNNIKNLEGPVFLTPAWGPLRLDKNNKIFYRHHVTDKKGVYRSFEQLFNDQTNKEYKNDNIIYGQSRKPFIKKLKEIGYKVLSINVYTTDKEENYYPLNEDCITPSYLNLFDHDQCKLIVLVEKVYKAPLLTPYSQFAPTNSFLPFLCSLSFFAEKINVYGWDYYLDSSPENMSFWQLIFILYKFKNDGGAKLHFESALINFYYGYQLSKLPNFKIHGYMGQLGKHHRLIKRIERVLFN